MIRYYFNGLFILLFAILVNYIAGLLQLKTWYTFLEELASSNYLWKSTKIMDVIWLFILYPLLLGVSSFLGNLLYQKLF